MYVFVRVYTYLYMSIRIYTGLYAFIRVYIYLYVSIRIVRRLSKYANKAASIRLGGILVVGLLRLFRALAPNITSLLVLASLL